MASKNNLEAELVNLGAERLRDHGPVIADRRPAPSRDDQIRLEVMEALHWDLAIPPRRITVEVDEGWIVLRGDVQRAYSKHRAEWAARGARGVVGLTNEIRVAE